MLNVSSADQAVIRRFAATVREQGSRSTSPALRAEVRSILLRGHLAAARAARAAGHGVAAKAHLAWVTRLSLG